MPVTLPPNTSSGYVGAGVLGSKMEPGQPLRSFPRYVLASLRRDPPPLLYGFTYISFLHLHSLLRRWLPLCGFVRLGLLRVSVIVRVIYCCGARCLYLFCVIYRCEARCLYVFLSDRGCRVSVIVCEMHELFNLRLTTNFPGRSSLVPVVRERDRQTSSFCVTAPSARVHHQEASLGMTLSHPLSRTTQLLLSKI